MTSRRRLHPAAVLAEALSALRQAALPLVIVALVGGGVDRLLIFGALGALVSVVAAFVQWRTTWWSIEDDAVRLKRGVFSERITSVPLERVQAVDTVRGPVQRLFGVVELHVQAAGGGRAGEIVLSAVGPADAELLRAAVGARPHDDNDSSRTESLRSWRLSRSRLLVAALTSGSLGVLLPVVAAGSQVLDDVFDASAAERFVPSSPAEAAMLGGAVVVLAWVLSFLGTIVAFAGFTATRDGERIRIRRGIVERREASVPVGRIHAVRIVESPLREPLGLALVRIESAGYASEPASAQTLLPLVRRSEVDAVLASLLPEIAAGPGDLAAPPRRAGRRFVVLPATVGAVAAAGLLVAFGTPALPALLLPLAGAALGVARFRAAGWRLEGDALVLRGRRLARTTAIANPHRLQRVTRSQSPFQRRAELATVEVAVSSGRRAGVAHLESATADELVGRLARLAVG